MERKTAHPVQLDCTPTSRRSRSSGAASAEAERSVAGDGDQRQPGRRIVVFAGGEGGHLDGYQLHHGRIGYGVELDVQWVYKECGARSLPIDYSTQPPRWPGHELLWQSFSRTQSTFGRKISDRPGGCHPAPKLHSTASENSTKVPFGGFWSIMGSSSCEPMTRTTANPTAPWPCSRPGSWRSSCDAGTHATA